MRKRIAIFGCNGYLGSQLFASLQTQGCEVEGFDIPECDVLDSSFWQKFRPQDYDSVLFFAGMTGTEKSFEVADRFMSVNVQGMLNLLNSLAPFGKDAPFVVFPSSRLVYRGSDRPLKEDSPKEAKTVYAASKLASEALLQAYAARYGLRYAVIRICVPYGNVISSDFSYGTVGFFLRQAQSGKITLYGDGSIERTFTHVSDLCRAVWLLSSARCEGTYNVGGCRLSLKQAAEVVAAKFGAEVVCVPWPDVALKCESGSTVFDSSRLDQVVGFSSYHCFEDI